MPDKSHDADIMRHRTPPGLKRTGVIVLIVAGVIVVGGIGLRLYNDQHHRAMDRGPDGS